MKPKDLAIKISRFYNELLYGGQSEKAKIADRMLKLIYARVKKGWGVDGLTGTPNYEPLKALTSLPYVEFRRRVKLGPLGRPTKSNLTLSGQMLNAMKFKVDKNITLFIDDSGRDPIIYNKKNGAGGRIKQTKTNAEVAALVQENGRIFFALTQDEIDQAQIMYEQWVNRLIRKHFGG